VLKRVRWRKEGAFKEGGRGGTRASGGNGEKSARLARLASFSPPIWVGTFEKERHTLPRPSRKKTLRKDREGSPLSQTGVWFQSPLT